LFACRFILIQFHKINDTCEFLLSAGKDNCVTWQSADARLNLLAHETILLIARAFPLMHLESTTRVSEMGNYFRNEMNEGSHFFSFNISSAGTHCPLVLDAHSFAIIIIVLLGLSR